MRFGGAAVYLDFTLQYHRVTSPPLRGSGYRVPGDPETTADKRIFLDLHPLNTVFHAKSADINACGVRRLRMFLQFECKCLSVLFCSSVVLHTVF